jgi:hypothetical protein
VGFLFRTSVSSVPFTFLTNEDYVAFADGAQPATVTPATPESAVAFLIADVDGLVASGDVSAGQAAGLLDKLNEILAKIANGQIGAAINQATAFINQVQALVNAGLDPQLGQTLIDLASEAIALLTN